MLEIHLKMHRNVTLGCDMEGISQLRALTANASQRAMVVSVALGPSPCVPRPLRLENIRRPCEKTSRKGLHMRCISGLLSRSSRSHLQILGSEKGEGASHSKGQAEIIDILQRKGQI